MCTLPRNISALLTNKGLSSTWNLSKIVTIKRNVQTFPVNLSTVPSVKTQEPLVHGIGETSFDYEKIGRTRQKINVDGMMLNWDVVGNGEHVILMLPGSLGIIFFAIYVPIFIKLM